MATTIDHLRIDHRVRILRDFSDANGRKYHVGETAVIREMNVDWIRFDLSIVWERDGRKESLLFRHARKGPGNGRMREYFEVEERVPLPEDTIEGRRARKTAELRASVPELVEAPITDPQLYANAVARIWALVARNRFEEAEQQIQLILEAPDEHGSRLQDLADDLVSLAAAYLHTPDGEVYDWFRDRGIGLWYAWGSQATSGGEGTVRSGPIRAAEARVPQRSS